MISTTIVLSIVIIAIIATTIIMKITIAFIATVNIIMIITLIISAEAPLETIAKRRASSASICVSSCSPRGFTSCYLRRNVGFRDLGFRV